MDVNLWVIQLKKMQKFIHHLLLSFIFYFQHNLADHISLLNVCCSVTKFCPTLCDCMNRSTPCFSFPYHLLEFVQVHVQWISNAIQHLILCYPLHLLPSIILSIRVFPKWVSCSHQVAEVQSLSFSISPSKEYSGLISFRID